MITPPRRRRGEAYTTYTPAQVVGLKHEVQEQQRKIEALRGEQLGLQPSPEPSPETRTRTRTRTHDLPR